MESAVQNYSYSCQASRTRGPAGNAPESMAGELFFVTKPGRTLEIHKKKYPSTKYCFKPMTDWRRTWSRSLNNAVPSWYMPAFSLSRPLFTPNDLYPHPAASPGVANATVATFRQLSHHKALRTAAWLGGIPSTTPEPSPKLMSLAQALHRSCTGLGRGATSVRRSSWQGRHFAATNSTRRTDNHRDGWASPRQASPSPSPDLCKHCSRLAGGLRVQDNLTQQLVPRRQSTRKIVRKQNR